MTQVPDLPAPAAASFRACLFDFERLGRRLAELEDAELRLLAARAPSPRGAIA